MDSIKENYTEEEKTEKKKPLSSAERQKLYRINNPERSKQIQQKYRDKTSVKNVKLLLDDKDAEIERTKLELEGIKDLLKFLMEKVE
jgi:hypothetical protein